MELVPSIGIEGYGLNFGWKVQLTPQRLPELGQMENLDSKYGITGQRRRGTGNVLLAFPEEENPGVVA